MIKVEKTEKTEKINHYKQIVSFIAGIVCYYFGYKDISWVLLIVTISSNAVLLFTGINEMIDDYFD